VNGLRVGIIGAGRSGVAAAKFLRRLGVRVLLSDRQRITASLPSSIQTESGPHSDRLLDCDLIIRSPGVPNHLPIMKKIALRRIRVWSELELASRFARAEHLVAITGTNGKTTTTTLVGEFFKTLRRPLFVAGNIGMPLSEVALKTTPRSTIVLEVSSYQLENIESFHPTLSAILNITPDHLEHHGSMKAYASAKGRIFENQTKDDVCVLNADDPWCRRLARRCPARVCWFSRRQKVRKGVYYDGHGNIVLRWGNYRSRFALRTHLPGPHNIENILAAVALALAGGVSLSAIRRVLARFHGVEHRLELVRILHGVRYVNDSKATNVDSTRVALASFADPLIVILGGEGKGAPYSPLKSLIRKRAKRLLVIGEDTPAIVRELKGIVPLEKVGHLAKAVQHASRVAEHGDVVLLSPACASFDQYNNYEERGRHFKRLVKKLA